MRYRPTRVCIGQPTPNGLQDVQMVLNVVQGAVIGQAVEKLPNSLFCIHFDAPLKPGT